MRNVLLTALVLFLLGTTAGCGVPREIPTGSGVPQETPIGNHSKPEEPKSSWAIGSDKYVFIEHWIHRGGELIEGRCPILCVDFPAYSFDEANHVLSGWIDFDVNEDLKIVYGSGLSLSGYAGMGAASILHGVYKLPYEHELQRLKITRVDADGTAYIEYGSTSIILGSGEKWVNKTTSVDTKQYEDNSCTVKLTITDTIVNYGILDKSKIKKK